MKEKQLKIAIFSGIIPSTAFIESLIEGMAKFHKVQLFGVMDKKTRYASHNVSVHMTPKNNVLNLVLTLWRTLLLGMVNPSGLIKLLKEIKKHPRRYEQWIWFSKLLPIVLQKPDVFHIQWARDIEFYAVLAKKFDIPIVVSLRGAHINYTPIVKPRIAEVYEQTFGHVTAFHAVSEAIALKVQKYGVQPQKIKVIPSLLNPKVWLQKPKESKIQNVIKLLSVGRFHWVKGYGYALSALAQLKQQGFRVEYTIVSSSPINEELLFQIHQLDLMNEVKVLQPMAQEDLFGFMTTFDIMLLPSLEEGIANVVLEAMVLKLPVISTDCGGMSEVIKPKDTGWLVPVRNPKAIAEAIIEISQTSSSDMERVTKNAFHHVKTHFDADASLKQFLGLYERVMNDS